MKTLYYLYRYLDLIKKLLEMHYSLGHTCNCMTAGNAVSFKDNHVTLHIKSIFISSLYTLFMYDMNAAIIQMVEIHLRSDPMQTG